jgi:hypothetical protein
MFNPRLPIGAKRSRLNGEVFRRAPVRLMWRKFCRAASFALYTLADRASAALF